jgi:hypothetical protein
LIGRVSGLAADDADGAEELDLPSLGYEAPTLA